MNRDVEHRKDTCIVWEWIPLRCGHICVRAQCCSLKGSPEGRRKRETRARRVASTGLKLMASTRRIYGGRKEEGKRQRTPNYEGQAHERETTERNRGQRGRGRIRRASTESAATEKALSLSFLKRRARAWI